MYKIYAPIGFGTNPRYRAITFAWYKKNGIKLPFPHEKIRAVAVTKPGDDVSRYTKKTELKNRTKIKYYENKITFFTIFCTIIYRKWTIDTD